MHRVVRESGFAILAWLLPFAASVCIFPLKSSHPPLFESLMAVILATSTTALGCWYLRGAAGNYLMRGARIGATWTAANWLLDSLMFSSGPMAMSLPDYVTDIGVAYLMIPPITLGLGFVATAAVRRQVTQPG